MQQNSTQQAVHDKIPQSASCGQQVEDWAAELFAEKVVRGGPALAVSLNLSAMEPGFRAAAELGAWQLIIPVKATGSVVVVSNLHEVQTR